MIFENWNGYVSCISHSTMRLSKSHDFMNCSNWQFNTNNHHVATGQNASENVSTATAHPMLYYGFLKSNPNKTESRSKRPYQTSTLRLSQAHFTAMWDSVQNRLDLVRPSVLQIDLKLKKVNLEGVHLIITLMWGSFIQQFMLYW